MWWFLRTIVNVLLLTSQLHPLKKTEEFHRFLRLLHHFVLQKKCLPHFLFILVLVFFQQNQRKPVLLENCRCFERTLCRFYCLHVLQKSLENLLLVGRVIFWVFDVLQFWISQSRTWHHQLNEFTQCEKFTFLDDGLLEVAGFFEEVVMGRPHGPVINEVKRRGTHKFGVNFKVFHHFKQGLKRLMCRLVGIELGWDFISKINLHYG